MNIGIIGLGLIGGSLGLDWRSQGHKIFGVSRRESTREQAIACGAVDTASADLTSLKTTEVIFICTPLAAIRPTVEQLKQIPHLDPETFLSDVGSVKAPIVDAIAPLWQNFVGGHPMAGKAESGIEVAQKGLFASKPYVITPKDDTPPTAVQVVEQLARSLQATIYHCHPADHDRAVSWISHLPVMVSTSLIAACTNESDLNVLQLAQQLASSGFRDTSRVGGGNPELGVMMARYNRSKLLHSLRQYRDRLDEITQLIECEDWQALEQKLNSNHLARTKFVKE